MSAVAIHQAFHHSVGQQSRARALEYGAGACLGLIVEQTGTAHDTTLGNPVARCGGDSSSLQDRTMFLGVPSREFRKACGTICHKRDYSMSISPRRMANLVMSELFLKLSFSRIRLR